MHRGWWGNLRERHNLEEIGIEGRIILDGSSESGMGASVALIWLMIETGGGHF